MPVKISSPPPIYIRVPRYKLEADTQSADLFRLTFTVHHAYPCVEGSERRQKHARSMHRHAQNAIKYDQSLPTFSPLGGGCRGAWAHACFSGIPRRPGAIRGAPEPHSTLSQRLPQKSRLPPSAKSMRVRNLRSMGAGRGAQRAHGERHFDGNVAANADEPQRVRSDCARSTRLRTSCADSSAFSNERED